MESYRIWHKTDRWVELVGDFSDRASAEAAVSELTRRSPYGFDTPMRDLTILAEGQVPWEMTPPRARLSGLAERQVVAT